MTQVQKSQGTRRRISVPATVPFHKPSKPPQVPAWAPKKYNYIEIFWEGNAYPVRIKAKTVNRGNAYYIYFAKIYGEEHVTISSSEALLVLTPELEEITELLLKQADDAIKEQKLADLETARVTK